jgi:hypothetical protein
MSFIVLINNFENMTGKNSRLLVEFVNKLLLFFIIIFSILSIVHDVRTNKQLI